MSILQELIGKDDFSEFIHNYLFQKPYSAAFSGKNFKNLFGWPMLDEIFEMHHNNCWLAANGKLSKDQTGIVTSKQAREAFEMGRTILVRRSEKAHHKLSEIALDFQTFFDRRVDVQLYATPKEQEGFDWHYDIEDVFVVQSQGEKEFRLLSNTVTDKPLPMMTLSNCKFHQEKSTPEIRCLLKAGDFLYIPSGYWHKAKALTDSFHISIGIMM